MTRGERIYTVFKKLHSNPNQILIDRYKEVFETDDIFYVYFFLERLFSEIQIYEEELKSLNVPEEIYKPVLQKLKALILNYNFNNYLRNFAISPELLARFYGFSFQGQNEEEIELNLTDDIKLMQEAVKDLKNQELKLILEDITQTINKLQTLPKICGKIAIEESFKELYCKTKINIDELQKAPKSYQKALINAYVKIDKSLSFAEKWLSRGENLIKLIENLGG